MSASPDVLVVEDDQDMADALLHLLEIWGFSARHAEHGKAALEAVFAPTKSQFLYFVAKYDGTGGHEFSSNRADHERAVDRYIRNR